MNWQEIKEKCPKAWGKALDYYEFSKLPIPVKEKILSLLEDESLSRILYDFFDEQGIYITILYDGLAPFQAQITQEGKTENESEYVWHLPNFRILPTHDRHYKKYKTRTKAEEQAFIKAFEILENKL